MTSEKSLQEERGALTLEIQEFVREKGVKESELEKIALQLEEERSEFENYRSAAQSELERNLEANEADRRTLEEERMRFQQTRDETLAELQSEHQRLEKDRETFESTRSTILAELTSERGELTGAVDEFERMRNEASAKLDTEKAKVRDKEIEVEKIREELVQQKWKLVRERKHYDEERKQLARLLLGMGEKISTNGIGNQAEDVLGDDMELSALQRELPVYNGEIGEAQLLGTVPIYPSTTVGDIRTFIAEKYVSSPGFSLKKRTTPIRRSADGNQAVDYFRPGDYVITQNGEAEKTP